MSRHRSDDYYDDCEDYLDYGYSEDQEESYDSESNKEDDVEEIKDHGNITPDVIDVTPLLCKTHGANFSSDCAQRNRWPSWLATQEFLTLPPILLLVPKPTGKLLPSFRHNFHLWPRV